MDAARAIHYHTFRELLQAARKIPGARQHGHRTGRDSMDPTDSPALYEIATRDWLQARSRVLGRRATFDDVADQELDRIAGLGFDWVWLLGVWRTGDLGRQVSRTQPEWRRAYPEILPDFTEADVCGSPYAVQGYAVHDDFGGDAALARLLRRL